MQNRRHERVRELLKRELSVILQREFPSTEAGLVTVNDVTVSGDLHSATVFVGLMGSPEQKRRGLEMLDAHRVRIQNLVGAAVVLRYTPTLRFVADESVARGNRVLQILDELERTQPPAAP